MASPYMNLVLPTVGPLGTQGPDWANEINAALDTIDAHDHSSGKGKQITPAGININQTFQMNDNQISEIASLALDNLSVAPTGSNLIYDLGGELYFKDKNGTAVQITSGGAVNVSGVGGIGGDYSTTPGALVSYSNTSKGYSFFQAAGITGFLDCGAVSIYRNTSGSPKATIQQQVSQTGNLTWSLPDNYPASTLPIKSSNAGVLTIDQIQTADIATSAVIASKLATDSVETAKIVNLNVTTGKLADQAVTSGKIANDTIVNANINSSASIAYSKLSLSNSIVNTDIATGAGIERAKLAYPTLFAGQTGMTGSTSSTSYGNIFSSTLTVPTPSYRFFMNFKSAYGGTSTSRWALYAANSGTYEVEIRVIQNGTTLYQTSVGGSMDAGQYLYWPASILNTILYTNWIGSAYSFSVQAKVSSVNCTFSWQNMTLELVTA